MQRPPFLVEDKIVSLVAPGRRVTSDQVQHAKSVLQSWGLRVVVGDHVFGSSSYFSASDKERLRDLQSALSNPEVNAIFLLRGGYGITRILDKLDFSDFTKRPKWVVGFSDVTALHLKLERVGVETIHGIMPIFFSAENHSQSLESLKELIFGSPLTISTKAHKANRLGEATGTLIGGNLSLLVDSLGTETALETESKILILEEIDEYYYKVDRMLMQLLRAGKLNNLAALIVGHMTGIKNTDIDFGETIYEMVMNKLKGTDFPVAFHFPSGHEAPNLPWRHGAPARLKVTEGEVRLTYLD